MAQKSEPSPKQKVVIDLPPILEAYLRFAVNTPKDQETISVSRNSDFGKLINAFLSKSRLRPTKQTCKNPVSIYVPETKFNQISLDRKHVYISSEDQEQISDFIEVYFNRWVNMFFEIGYELNLSQLDIIESILDILNMRVNATNFDQIKKRDYRKTKSDIRKRTLLILKTRLSEV